MEKFILTLEEFKKKEEENEKLLIDDLEDIEKMEEGIVKTISRGIGNVKMLLKSPIDKKIMLKKRQIVDNTDKIKKLNQKQILSKRDNNKDVFNSIQDELKNAVDNRDKLKKDLIDLLNDKKQLNKDNKEIKKNKKNDLKPKKGIFTGKFGSKL